MTLNIRVLPFNDVVKRPALLKKLRQLTIYPYSGMNYELNRMERDAKRREVQCKILLAYQGRKLVGWGMLSKETSDFQFANTNLGFDTSQGTLFEIYVDPTHRRQGIGSELMKVARRKAGSSRLCICPHDYASEQFYSNFERYKHMKL